MSMIKALRRIGNSISHSDLENLFFLHIPKCGGTSVRHAMSEPYDRLGRKYSSGVVHINADPMRRARRLLTDKISSLEATHLEEHILLYFMSQKRTRFIDGHVPFPAVAHETFGDRFHFVTLLRDPVDRWISEYSYNRFHGSEHMRETADLSIEQYLDSGFGIGQGRQYVLYIGGRRPNEDYLSQAALDAALANIEKFSLIGCVEEMPAFERAFAARFGWRLRIPKLNVNPRPDGFLEETFTPAIRERIREICSPDYVLYDRIRGSLQR